PDQALVTDLAAVEDRTVADHHVAPHPAGEARVGMDDHTVLDVAPGPDRDPVGVAAEHRVEPDARVRAECDIADDLGAVGNVGTGIDLGVLTAEGANGHRFAAPFALPPSPDRFAPL